MEKDKSSDKSKTIKIALIISTVLVIFIPMLYSTIYLGAFWDPYNNLTKVPVAVVNLDKKITKDGKVFDIGNELTKNLKNNKKLDWKFVDDSEAKKGLEGSTYYAVVTVPEDFSKKISEVSEGKNYDSKIIYSANKGKNYIFSQLSKKATENIKSEISSNIQKEISKSLVENMYTIKDSIKDAGDGVEELKSGSQKLSDGSMRLSEGSDKAYAGSVKLESGLKSASSGSEKLSSGIELLKGGGTKLSTGVQTAKLGTEKLISGLDELSSGEEKVSNGTGELVVGLETLRDSLVAPNESINMLVKGTEELSSYNSKMAKGTEELSNTLNQKLNGAADNLKVVTNSIDSISNSLKSEIQNIENSNMNSEDKEKLKATIMSLEKINVQTKSVNVEASLREASHAAEPLRDGMKKLDVESKKVSQGVGMLAKGLEETQSKAKVGVDKLLGGAKEIQNGSEKLLVGLNTASSKTGELTLGLGSIYEGTVSLNDGLNSAGSGSISLKEGLNTAADKTGELSHGLKSLNTGAGELTEGLQSLDEGNEKLRVGLNDGYEQLNDKLKFNANDMAKFIGNPVTLEEDSINEVNHYGEGLAPYFVSLSLWLGAMFINLILTISKKFNTGKHKKLNGFIQSLLIGSVLVSLQSVILSVSLVVILKLTAFSMTGFFLSNIFISIVFFSLMYGVSYGIGIIGVPIMFIYFILQISSAGGTFPIETAPTFYRMINSVIPMTYSVNVLRMVISGINTTVFNHNLLMLTEFMVISLIGGVAVNKIINKIKINRNNQENKKIIEI